MKEKGEAASILLPWRLTWPPFTSPLFPPVNHLSQMDALLVPANPVRNEAAPGNEVQNDPGGRHSRGAPCARLAAGRSAPRSWR